jgi:hypothetical protein
LNLCFDHWKCSRRKKLVLNGQLIIIINLFDFRENSLQQMEIVMLEVGRMVMQRVKEHSHLPMEQLILEGFWKIKLVKLLSLSLSLSLKRSEIDFTLFFSP